MTFSDLLAANADASPARPALRTPEVTISWRQLRDRAATLSGQVFACGAGRGDRVALLAQGGLACCIAMHGVAWGGHVLTPLNFRLSGRELIELLEDCDPALILVDAAMAPMTADWPAPWRD